MATLYPRSHREIRNRPATPPAVVATLRSSGALTTLGRLRRGWPGGAIDAVASAWRVTPTTNAIAWLAQLRHDFDST
jgi:hypothetical protein